MLCYLLAEGRTLLYLPVNEFFKNSKQESIQARLLNNHKIHNSTNNFKTLNLKKHPP